MSRFRYQSETAGEHSHRELQNCEPAAGDNRSCGDFLLISFIAREQCERKGCRPFSFARFDRTQRLRGFCKGSYPVRTGCRDKAEKPTVLDRRAEGFLPLGTDR